MKIRLYLCIMFCVSRIYALANTSSINSIVDSTNVDINPVQNEVSLDSIVFNLTLAVNSISEILTGATWALTAITVLIALLGFLGYSRLNKDIKRHNEELLKRTDVQDSIINEYKNLVNSLREEQKSFIEKNQKIINILNQQDLYFSQTINYLYQATDAICNQIKDESKSKIILNNLYHGVHIANLYHCIIDEQNDRVSDNDKFAAFSYLEENGTEEDIIHLEFSANNDPNKNNRIRATEIIGRIRERTKNY